MPIRAQIVWAKERLVIGRGDYHWQHEPCWYAVRTKGHWTGGRKQTTLWTIPSGGQDAETQHGTQKPVECMRRPMLNHTRAGEAVYEPFLGSGTTLIAAETIGRVCLAVELDPRYVDVAVRRWQAFTGATATRLADGRTFDDIAHMRLAGPTQAKPCGEGSITAGTPEAEPHGPDASPAKDRGATTNRARNSTADRSASATAHTATGDEPRKVRHPRGRQGAGAEPTAAVVATHSPHGAHAEPPSPVSPAPQRDTAGDP